VAPDYDTALFDQLRDWRRETATQEGRKAFYVFPDATLQRIAAAQPQTLDELQAVKGVGPKKREQYGPDVLDITRGLATSVQGKPGETTPVDATQGEIPPKEDER
jgi:superfamily II DNA helicase RecQ